MVINVTIVVINAPIVGEGGAGTFLMENMPKSTQRVVGVFCNFRKVPMVLFCHKKERGGTPRNI